jgi:glycosyltransferase involved in cell wall biosynthesis
MKTGVLIRKGENPGGGVASMESLADMLGEQHEVEVFTVNPHRWLPELPFPVEVKKSLLLFLGLLESLSFYRELSDFDPDLVLSQHEPALLGSLITAPQVLFLRGSFFLSRSYETTKAEGAIDGLSSIINRTISLLNDRFYAGVIKESKLVLSNSEYTAEQYRRNNGIDSAVVYPFIETSEFETESNGDYVLHVNPSHHKGIDITLNVAAELEDERFLVVGSGPDNGVKERMNGLDNVEYVGYLEDMREAYSRAKIVMVPSRFEPFGRIPVEAGINGIPAVVSNAGGLAESVETTELVVDENVPQEYIQKINNIKSDYEYYAKISRQNALEKSANNQIDKLIRLLAENGDIHV